MCLFVVCVRARALCVRICLCGECSGPLLNVRNQNTSAFVELHVLHFKSLPLFVGVRVRLNVFFYSDSLARSYILPT